MLRSLSPGRCPGLRYIALSGLVILLAIDLIGRKTQNKEMSMVFMSRKMILSQKWNVTWMKRQSKIFTGIDTEGVMDQSPGHRFGNRNEHLTRNPEAR